MAQPQPTTAIGSGAEAEFLPVLNNPEVEQPRIEADQKRQRAEIGPAPHGTPEEAQTILAGLPESSLGRTIALPAPRIVHDFRLAAALERKVALGKSCWGERNWIGICGGDWSATWGKGKIVVCS